MDKLLHAEQKLVFKHEVLRSRLDIRDFFLNNAVKEVYENIGQVLSVARMQLAVLEASIKDNADVSTSSTGQLVGQSIRDLRSMCRNFYPDLDILKEDGYSEAFQHTLGILFRNAEPVLEIKGVRKDIQPGLKLVIFRMMHEILILIKENCVRFISISICYTSNKVKFVFSYVGETIALNDEISTKSLDTELTLQQRAQLVDGRFDVTKNKSGITIIKFTSPFKTEYYG